jgi:hypothetical protein
MSCTFKCHAQLKKCLKSGPPQCITDDQNELCYKDFVTCYLHCPCP